MPATPNASGSRGCGECARGDLPPLELGHLSLQLQRIDQRAAERLDDRAHRRRPVWKLPQDDARELAQALEAEGLPDRQIAAMATVTTKTVRNWRGNPEARYARVARGHGVKPATMARAIEAVRRLDDGSPVGRLDGFELLDEIAIAATRREPDRRVNELLDQLVRVPKQPRKPAFQSGEKWKIGPTLGNGSDPAKKTPAARQTTLFEGAPAA